MRCGDLVLLQLVGTATKTGDLDADGGGEIALTDNDRRHKHAVADVAMSGIDFLRQNSEPRLGVLGAGEREIVEQHLDAFLDADADGKTCRILGLGGMESKLFPLAAQRQHLVQHSAIVWRARLRACIVPLTIEIDVARIGREGLVVDGQRKFLSRDLALQIDGLLKGAIGGDIDRAESFLAVLDIGGLDSYLGTKIPIGEVCTEKGFALCFFKIAVAEQVVSSMGGKD